MKLETGNPVTVGVYAVCQYFCWRILEWDGAKWWHQDKHAEWPMHVELEGWCGPLPTRTVPIEQSLAYKAAVAQRAMEFDL